MPIHLEIPKGTAPSLPWEEWTKWTWGEVLEDVQIAAKGFYCLGGLRSFGTVTIHGFNAPEWILSALAAMHVGGKNAGIYPTDTVAQIVYSSVLARDFFPPRLC